MRDEMKKVPRLRFRGFQEDWELCKLGDVADHFEYGLNASAIEYDGKNKYLRITDIDDSSRKFIQNKLTSPNINVEEASNYILTVGDILFARTGASVGKTYRYDIKDGKVYFAGFLIRARIKDSFDSEFVYWTTLTDRYNTFIKIMSQRSGQPGINAKEYSSFNNLIPNIKEQLKIGAFLKKIDDTSALHQRKLEQLKELKKAYLQLMFASTNTKNDKLPKLRFTGFKGYWELCKLSDISDKVKEKNKHGKFTETLTNSAEYGIINQRVFFDKDISNVNNLNSYYVVQNDDFVYNPRISNFAPVGPIKRNRLGRTGVMSPLYYVFRTHSIDNNYLEKYFDTVYWHHFMELNGDTGARADRFAIKDSIFVEMPIPYPSTEEQQKIGIFFKKLDQSITLYKNKLNQRKALKKAYHQNMFI